MSIRINALKVDDPATVSAGVRAMAPRPAAAEPVSFWGLQPLARTFCDLPLKSFFQPAGLHEFYAASSADIATCAGLALLLALHHGQNRPLFWIRQADAEREGGVPYPPGLAELGVDPGAIVLVRTPDVRATLQAGLDVARCSAASGAIVEFRGESRAYDLTASRRLSLAARASQRRIFILRSAAAPTPSAAETRWCVRSQASAALAANAPGLAVFEVQLLRHRHGLEGIDRIVAWNRDDGESPAPAPARIEA